MAAQCLHSWLGPAHAPCASALRFLAHLPMRQDILVNHDDFVMEGSGDSRADVTVHCDTSSYILLIYGRFNLDWASVIGKATIEGPPRAGHHIHDVV